MKKIAVMFGLLMLAAIIAISVASSANYSPGSSGVERNVGAFIADGSPRPPFPPVVVADGSPRPPFPPVVVADGSPRPPFPPVVVADDSSRTVPPALSA
jgi:hypothetical protein